MAKEKAFIKRLIFRLIKKRIAGGTINTAFNVAKELNAKKIRATITFLNEGDSATQKARYNLMSYMELVNRIGRLHIEADVSLRLSQISSADMGSGESNLAQLAEVAKANGVTLWLEYEPAMGAKQLAAIYARHVDECSLGIELPVRMQGIEKIEEALPANARVKLFSHGFSSASGPAKKGKKPKSLVDTYIEHASMLIGTGAKVCISEGDERIISRIVQQGRYKKDLIFELPLGYSKKWQSKLSGKGVRISVYVPYGKDWIPYAINRLTEGRIREIRQEKQGCSWKEKRPLTSSQALPAGSAVC